MKLQLLYNFSYFRILFYYVLIPIIVIVSITGISLVKYSKEHKDHNNMKYIYVVNFWSYLIAIVLCCTILSLSLGFALAVLKLSNYYAVSKIMYLLYLCPLIPFSLLVFFCFKIIKLILSKKKNPDIYETVKTVQPVQEVSANVEPTIPVMSVNSAETVNTDSEIIQQPTSSSTKDDEDIELI